MSVCVWGGGRRVFRTGRWKTHLCDKALGPVHCPGATLLHQSFVTTAPIGSGNSRDIDFPLCKARIYAQHCGDIFMVKALFKSRWVTVKLHRLVWAWKQKPCGSMALPGQCWRDSTVVMTKNKKCWVQNVALKPHYPRPHRGCGLVHNDWCINASNVTWLIHTRKGMQENENHCVQIKY